MFNTLLAFSGYSGVKKVLLMDFSIEISETFVSCLDVQLTKDFETKTGIKVKPPIRMGWRQEDGFFYERGCISKINAKLYLKHGIAEVQILWQSKSGRRYELADTDIDCNDIEFWFEDLDAEMCKKYLNPTWSLFTTESFKFSYINDFKRQGIETSYEFLKCADERLTALFEKQTGLKVNSKLCLMVPTDKVLSVKNEGDVSKLELILSVNAHSNPVVIVWQSKSGRVYKMNDTDIDCNDIQFNFEKLAVEKYIEEFYPKGQKLPFVLKNLPFELVVTRLNAECKLLLTVKEGYENNREHLITEVESFTEKFNAASEKKSDDGEIVQQCLGTPEGKATIIFDIDMSLAGFDYVKKLLKLLSKKEGITKVEIA